MKKILFLAISIIFISCNNETKNPESNISEKEKIKLSEAVDFKLYLQSSASLYDNIVRKANIFHEAKYDGVIIKGKIYNSASIASFNRIVAVVKFWNENGEIMQEKIININKAIRPKGTFLFEEKDETPGQYGKFTIEIESAELAN